MKPFATAAHALALSDPGEKCAATERLWRALQGEPPRWDVETPLTDVRAPGRPERPLLVHPTHVPRRRLGNNEGRAALVHAIAHIEFNAINLALDAACRFRDMPPEFAMDWFSVAADEARHFQLLNERLAQLGHCYGDFTAHNGLWEMAEKTAHDCMLRMALVPRVLEARGLDVTPGMMQRLQDAGDPQTVEVLRVILDEEVRHVEIGSRWFRHCCESRGLPPDDTFLGLLSTHYGGKLRGPFNLEARLKAGFSSVEMDAITSAFLNAS